MADPTKIDLSDWLAILATAMVSGIGGAMAWFKASNKKVHDRVESVEGAMREWQEKQAEHSTEIAVVKTCQENTAERLELINQTTRDTNESVKELSQTVTQVLLALQQKQ